jgi:arylsulfatase A-like enzyme
MKTANFFLVSGLTLAAACSCTSTDQPMNVVYILADDLGYGDLGVYGQEIIQTPHLDQLAREGMVFTQHYAGTSVSAPSRAALMTGRHTGHTHIRGNFEISPEGQSPMPEGTFTIGHLMQQAGYSTGMFGKWGLGYPGSGSEPNDMGFDEFYGYVCQRQAHYHFPDFLRRNKENEAIPGNEENGRKVFAPDLLQQEGLNFIRTNKDKPFFAMFTFTIPHAELNLPHDSIYQLYAGRFEEQAFEYRGGYAASKEPKASYAALVTQLDAYVGEIIRELRILGLDKNTLVIFTSDNGSHREGGNQPEFFESSGPLRGVKRALYEGGIRVPTLAWLPGKVAAGTTTDHISAFWDMLPTLADITNQKLKVKTDGISMLPTLFGKKSQPQHEYLYWEFHEDGGRQAVRMGDWKAVRQRIASGNPTFELYNLKDDIGETTNLAVEKPEIAERLRAIMDSARTESEMFNFGIRK